MGVTEADAIRPFSFEAPESDLADLRKRIQATKWPEREQVADDSQGVKLDTIQKLARYWATKHDWRKCEARLNALPQFVACGQTGDRYPPHGRVFAEDMPRACQYVC